MAVSKLFTPKVGGAGECFVRPQAGLDAGTSFAPTDRGEAAYPQRLGAGAGTKTPGVPKRSVSTARNPDTY